MLELATRLLGGGPKKVFQCRASFGACLQDATAAVVGSTLVSGKISLDTRGNHRENSMQQRQKGKPTMKMKCVTLSVDVGVYVPEEVDDDDIAIQLNHDSIRVTHTDTEPIKGGKVICHTTTGVVDSYTEEDAEKMRTEPLPEELS